MRYRFLLLPFLLLGLSVPAAGESLYDPDANKGKYRDHIPSDCYAEWEIRHRGRVHKGKPYPAFTETKRKEVDCKRCIVEGARYKNIETRKYECVLKCNPYDEECAV